MLFANRTGMEPPVAATAYLTLMTCPAANPRTLRALRAFRDRRADFGQGFYDVAQNLVGRDGPRLRRR